ncbi:MAG: transglycosylase SLT domain-containing protein, partial [Elusimicrobia bacterium]|nr:transglycosylase SLT domain-containing protein [Elusimicrobiota bacterium]
ARTRSLDGAGGQLERYQQGSGAYAGASGAADPGAVLFDGASGARGGAGYVPVSYTPGYSPRPAVQYTNLDSTIPSDLALAPPPSPAEARDIARYASLRSALIRGGAAPSVVDQAIRQAVGKNMDPLMVLAIGMQESGLHNDSTSPVGARGAMQLMPGTACGLGVCNVAALYNPAVNVSLGTSYFKGLWDQFVGSDMLSINPLSPFVIHRVENAIAAYNAGPGAVQKYGGVPPYRETADYVRKVIGYYMQFRRFQGRTVSV